MKLHFQSHYQSLGTGFIQPLPVSHFQVAAEGVRQVIISVEKHALMSKRHGRRCFLPVIVAILIGGQSKVGSATAVKWTIVSEDQGSVIDPNAGIGGSAGSTGGSGCCRRMEYIWP